MVGNTLFEVVPSPLLRAHLVQDPDEYVAVYRGAHLLSEESERSVCRLVFSCFVQLSHFTLSRFLPLPVVSVVEYYDPLFRAKSILLHRSCRGLAVSSLLFPLFSFSLSPTSHRLRPATMSWWKSLLPTPGSPSPATLASPASSIVPTPVQTPPTPSIEPQASNCSIKVGVLLDGDADYVS